MVMAPITTLSLAITEAAGINAAIRDAVSAVLCQKNDDRNADHQRDQYRRIYQRQGSQRSPPETIQVHIERRRDAGQLERQVRKISASVDAGYDQKHARRLASAVLSGVERFVCRGLICRGRTSHSMSTEITVGVDSPAPTVRSRSSVGLTAKQQARSFRGRGEGQR